MSIASAFILWARRRARYHVPVVRFDGSFVFRRWHPFWPDETVDSTGEHWNRPPWWRPFNAMLHWWRPGPNAEGMHDHPRWTITVVLRGRIVEMTPWWERELKPGSIVFRSRRSIHAFRMPEGGNGSAWTLFIVGRRNWPQSTYQVTRQRGRGQVKEK